MNAVLLILYKFHVALFLRLNLVGKSSAYSGSSSFHSITLPSLQQIKSSRILLSRCFAISHRVLHLPVRRILETGKSIVIKDKVPHINYFIAV